MIDLADYVAKYLAQYAAGADFEPILVKYRNQQVLRSIKRHAHRRVLEVGCGLAPMFLEFDDYEALVVVEPSDQFVERARSRAADRVEFRLGFLEDVAPTLRRDFDFVVVSSLLHEVPDPAGLLRAIHAVCSPHTVVHFNVSNARSLHRLLAHEMGLLDDLFAPSETAKKFQRHTMFDLASLRAALERAGFVVLESGSYFVKPFTNEQMSRLLASGILTPAMLDGLSRMAKYVPELGCEIFADVRRAG